MAVVLPMHATAMSATSLPAVILRQALPQTHKHTVKTCADSKSEATQGNMEDSRNSEDLHVTNH